ncbi:MAG: hypothetical protein IVW57_03850 [Ktedonobacterales bacterium]|nr:hypothetical protein [Ktedonobacterales bacterium]
MGEVRVGLIQMRSEKAAIAANLATMRDYLRDGERQGAAIICFPEACVTGYVDPVRHPGVALRLDGPEVAAFVAMTRATEMTAIAGLVEAQPAGPPFLTQVVARAGQPLGYYRKRTIPAEEAHLYAAGT